MAVGYTIAEKILARVSGKDSVRAGDEVMAKPDFVIAYDFPGYTDVYFRQMKEDFGIERVAEPERFAIFIDHMVPATSPKEEELHIGTRKWCAENNVAIYERRGIGHQVAAELGYATPGAFVVHFDGHVSQLGTFGALAMGIRRNLLEAFVRERISIKVPQTVRVNFTGTLQKGVMARDVFHHLVRVLGPSSCRFQVLEIGGPALEHISTEGLQTITGLAMFTGAVTAIVNPDPRRLAYALPRAKIKLDPVYSDPDAVYSAVHEVDLDDLQPLVVIPPTPANSRNLSEFLGIEIHAGYLGSCASGRLEDLRIAAEVLKGRQVKPGFALNVVPTSQEIMAAAGREGLLSVLAEAGAFISSPSCDYCFGRIATMTANQRAVSTGTLNVRGRMGSPDSEIYLCNAATVAASAIEGAIADPRKYL
jgi:3-isopropylmalate/(R)-2-methylmalate dehydratase large subunit